ncbi:MAG TPA: amino acid adenylation domain-containing protein [Bryobacteraceae bacterium]|nr:amino acid adenylation domain-containing protein [Bryobacteraceae bacterium]
MSEPPVDYRATLAAALQELRLRRAEIADLKRRHQDPIAVVGMACRFPGGSTTPEKFWELLDGQVDAVIEVPRDRWDIDAFYDPDPSAPGKMSTRKGAFLRSVDGFDALFFGISPREASSLDPQQKILLEVAWEALENANLAPDRLHGQPAGVFVGITCFDHAVMRPAAQSYSIYDGTGSALNMAAGRLSYVLGLTGPSMAIDTACSSSLVSLHLACESLRSGESETALACGVNLMLSPEVMASFTRARMIAADGRCKTFDAAADGYVRGEGCGVVVLKLLSDAVAHGDRIFGVIRGTAVNQGGPSGGLTVPSKIAQATVMRRSLERAGVAAESVSYVEAHGTGTALGDPIELEALAEVYGIDRHRANPLWVGSVKTNIGHLEPASGVAGLIKVLLAYRHGRIPASLHFTKPNPHFAWDQAALQVAAEPVAWPVGGKRIAGISAFGFSGTNAHAIVEEPPIREAAAESARTCDVLTLSAKSEEALRESAARWVQFLTEQPASQLASICRAAGEGRNHFSHRLAVPAADIAKVREGLASFLDGQQTGVFRGKVKSGAPPRVAFLFTGQGSQYAGMAAELYRTEPLFRRHLDHLTSVAGEPRLLDLMLVHEGAQDEIHQTAFAQPALFALEYALAELWISWGVRPDAVMGHSIGEYVAACVAGVMTPDDAMRIVAARGRLMQSLPQDGAMRAVFTTADRVRATLAGFTGEVGIAAVNGPANVVISGRREAVEAVAMRLAAAGVRSKELRVSHAFHSQLMQPMLDEFRSVLRSVKFSAPECKLISNITGKPVGVEVTEADYWVRHVMAPVEFHGSVEELGASGIEVLLEIGPDAVLTEMGRQCLPQAADRFVPTLQRRASSQHALSESVASLYVRGVEFDWAKFYHGVPQPDAILPNYPFEGRTEARIPVGGPMRDWLYRVEWQQAGPVPEAASGESKWLVIADRRGVGEDLARRIAGACLTIGPDDDFREALAELSGPVRIVFLRGLDAPDAGGLNAASLEQSQLGGCGALLELVRALEGNQRIRPRVWIVTRGAVEAGQGPAITGLAQAPLCGFSRGMLLERPEWAGAAIDLDPSLPGGEAAMLLAEILAQSHEDQIAFRAGTRLVPRLRRGVNGELAPLRVEPDAAYLITGGLGALGIEAARWLARSGARHLVLASRRERLSDKAAQILEELRSTGITVHAERADVADESQVVALFDRIATQGVPLRGVIHAAGLPGYRSLTGLDGTELWEMFRPKIAGAWNLHNACKDIPLEFFVCYSSIASVWGSREQTHYAAANRFLDGLAHYRHALGLPSLVVNWGPWSGGGMNSAEINRLLERVGVQTLPPESALETMGHLIGAGVTQAAVARIDWPRFRGSYEARGKRPLIEGIDDRPGAIPAGAALPATGLNLHAAPKSRQELAQWLREETAQVLGLGATLPECDRGFFELGMDSLLTVEFRTRLERALERPLPVTLVFDHPTIADLVNYLAGDEAPSIAAVPASSTGDPIAIIGMSCRLPGAADPEAFWRLLRDGVDAVTEVPPERWNLEQYYDADPEAPGKMYSRHGGFLDAIDRFDAAFFRISPREASSLDPQQRVLLEVAWHAIEDAGIAPDRLRGSNSGVFVGVTTNDYARLQMNGGADRLDAYFFTGNPLNTVAGRISYVLGWNGPSMAIDTACSSSLAAIHAACQSLRNGECELALAGGVNLILSPENTVAVCRTRALAPDGRCKTFDAAADGFVRSEGCGVVVLKPLAAAQRDGDRILALVRGSATNHDGASSGFTAPNGRAQEAVIRKALGSLPPGAVDYVEAHGTGTALGDPIEMQALSVVYGEGRAPDRKLLVGSVKTNIGHTESAAGVAGVIKTVLALRNSELPAHLHFRTPSPLIAWDKLAVQVSDKPTPWPANGRKRIAGVSAFGASGTNVHLVLEEAPVQPESPAMAVGPQALVISAKSEEALRELASRYAEAIGNSGAGLADICFSAATGRSHFASRLGVRAESAQEAVAKLKAAAEGRSERGVFRLTGRSSEPRIAFLFTGQGSQYAEMGRELYHAEPVFRSTLDRCAQILAGELERPLLDVMFAGPSDDHSLDQTAYCQPALLALEVALGDLLASWGIRPAAVMGHSLGEYTAACVAGALTLDDALLLTAARARLMQSLPRNGAMAAAFADEATIRRGIAAFGGLLSIAAVNGPRNIVISGDAVALQRVLEQLRETGVESRPLTVSHAFHSPLIEPMLDDFERIASKVSSSKPTIPLYSNLTAEPVTAPPNAAYWRRHCRDAVRFSDSVAKLADSGFNVLFELGPKPVLSAMARNCLPPDARVLIAPVLDQRTPRETLLDAVLQAYVRGVNVDWSAFYRHTSHRRVALPSYPFQRQRFWFQEDRTAMPSEVVTNVQESDHSRQPEILAGLQSQIARLLHVDAADVDVRLPFLEMGADSLVMVEAVRQIESQYGLKVAIRRFFEDLSTVEALASHVAANVAATPAPIPAPVTPPVAVAAAPLAIPPASDISSPALPQGAIERIFSEQNRMVSQLLSQQMELLKANLGGVREAAPPAPAVPALASSTGAPSQPAPVPRTVSAPASAPLLPWGTPKDQRASGLPERQQKHLAALVERYSKRTAKSKAAVQQSRACLADSRATVGFRFSTKEMLYPIVGAGTRGSRLWDIDGNEYIDFTMGFGVHLFGHAPRFLNETIGREFERAVELGARSDLAGEVAAKFAEMTGQERVAFCNSGTEAVMAAMRLARAGTGRDLIVMFTHAYHGHADGTLAAPDPESGLTTAVAPGVPQGSVANVLVLDYGTDSTLEVIRRRATELAAVMVEPVQSRDPALQPVAFLRDVREITRASGTALIFDEMITGFRVHPAGAQGYFGIDADIATYGKIIGGGLPLGVVAGKRRFMDGIDGGMWSFGDQSFPAADRTAFGGTFCQHPLAMSAALATLDKLRQEGPALQDRLNRRTAEIAATLNDFFESDEVPIRVTWFGSMFRFNFSANLDLFFYHLLERGFYIWEWRTCFLSTAHTQSDVDAFIAAVKGSVADLRDGGFLPERKRTETTRTFALTEAQKQLALQAQIDPAGSLAYTVNTSVRLDGPLDFEALTSSFRQAVRRHEALRLKIAPDGEHQMADRSLRIELPLVDLTVPGSESVEQWLSRDCARPFDLAAGPLFRASVLRVAEDCHILSLSAHHMICDGSTMGLLLEEIATSYSGRETPGEVMGFGEYVRLCSGRRDSQEMARHREYWLEQCKGAPRVLNLPTDHPRPPVRTFRGDRVSAVLGSQDAAALRQLARSNGCTLYMTLLAGFQSWLARLTRQDDLILGIPVAGRPFPGSERLAGYCTHLLPLRCRYDDSLSVAGVLGQSRKLLLDALEHQDYPFAELIRALQESGEMPAEPLVSVVFNLEPVSALPEMKGLRLSLTEPVVHYTAFDLSVNVIDTGGQLLIDCDYNTDLFERDTVERLLDSWRSLLAAMPVEPASPAWRLPLLSAAERRKILEEWNDTTATERSEACIHELFEAQVRRTPDAIAIIHGTSRISYRELDARAERLAGELISLGVAPEVPVGICARRTPDLIAGLLAILKAGGAYVPMDPEYPPARLAFMLEDARIPLLLTERDFKSRFAASAARVLLFDDPTVVRSTPAISRVRPAADNLGYIIYTSGSTGRPKGVALTHRNAVQFLHWAREQFSAEELQCVLASTSICFDLSVFEIFAPLSWGGAIVLSRNALELSEMPAAGEITLINSVPSVLAEVLRTKALPSSVRTVNLAGEPLPRQLVRSIYEHSGVKAVYNLYGPTEDTTYSTGVRLALDDHREPSIGRPIANTRAYILDAHLEPLPVGAAGEIFLGGAGLARGYLHNQELTEQRFIPDPFSRDGRLYRTGDLGRFRPDGNIEYLGRIDHQVKIRGFRIELGEIETALRGLPWVEAAIVIVREMESGKTLAAYVRTQRADATAVDEARRYLRERLPDHMIPASFVLMPQFPLLPNGKVDRKALPEAVSESDYVAPRDATESALVAIWQAVLGRQPIGVHEHFFEIGGHSLLSTQVVSRVRQELGVPLEIRDVFAFPTVAALARHIGRSRPQTFAPVPRVEAREDYELSPAQKRFWLRDRLDEGRGGAAPVAFRIDGVLDTGALERAVRTLLDRHEILRTVFTTSGETPRQRVLRPEEATLTLEVLDRSHAMDEEAEVQRIECHEALTALDLATGPLLRVKLVKLGPVRHVCIVSMHHIVTDGWSSEVLLDDLAEIYDSLTAGRPSSLEPLPLQYKDYAAWLSGLLRGPQGKQMREYWTGKLSGRLPVLNFPTDFEGAPGENRPRIHRFQVPADTVRELEELAHSSSATLFMVLVAALKAYLYRSTGQEDIIVGSPVAGRVRQEMERQVGPYLNVVALRDSIAGDDRFDMLLDRVRETTLDAYANQLYPLDWLLDELRVKRDPRRNPVFDVGFTLQNQLRGERVRRAGGIVITPIDEGMFEAGPPEARTRFWFLAEPRDGSLEFSIVYDGALFSENTTRRVAEDFCNVLETVRRDSRVRLHRLPVGAVQPRAPFPKVKVHLEIH